MELIFNTTNASQLKSDIIKLIEDKKLETWTIYTNANQKYLRHTKQWGEKGVIQITTDTTNRKLTAEVRKFDGIKEDVKDFEGYYLGRFCEIIFVNFPNRFTSIDKA